MSGKSSYVLTTAEMGAVPNHVLGIHPLSPLRPPSQQPMQPAPCCLQGARPVKDILDVGAATGLSSLALLKAFPGSQVTGACCRRGLLAVPILLLPPRQLLAQVALMHGAASCAATVLGQQWWPQQAVLLQHQAAQLSPCLQASTCRRT